MCVRTKQESWLGHNIIVRSNYLPIVLNAFKSVTSSACADQRSYQGDKRHSYQLNDNYSYVPYSGNCFICKRKWLSIFENIFI